MKWPSGRPVPSCHWMLVVVLPCMLTPLWAEAQGGVATVGGTMGSYAELNGISGAERRRPSATGRMFFRPHLSLFGKFTMNLDLLFSTENSTFQSSRRQSLNQYAIHPRWGWGVAHLGDFTDAYTPLTFGGVRVRGAGLSAQRGPVRVAAFGGRTQRSVPGGATTGRFERNMFGGRIGVGDPSRSSLDITVIKARDDVSSLTLPEDTVLIEPLEPDTTFVEDTLQVGIPSNPFAVTPQENLVLGLAGTLSLFERALFLRGELNGSGYTRDLRAGLIESQDISSEVPGVMRSLYSPRVSSTFDYALTLEANARVSALTAKVSYRNIGPGYSSLGVASVMSDQRSLQLNTSLRFRLWNVKVDGGRQHDNLIGQKLFTTNRSRFGVALAVRPTRGWSANLRVNYSGLGNDAPEADAQWIAYSSWIFGTKHNLTFSRRGILRSASLAYTYRSSGDENPLRTQSESKSHTFKIRVLAGLTRNLNLTPSVGIVRSRFGTAGWTTLETYELGVQLRLLRGKWATSLALGRSQAKQTKALQATLTSRYQFGRDAVTLVVRANDYDSSLEMGRDFREFVFTLRWARRL